MKKLSDYPLRWKLLLVPVVATVSFAAYLLYSSLVLSEGNSLLKELRDADFPILNAAEIIINNNDRLADALNTAAATGEDDYLDMAKVKAAEILSRYKTLEQLDTDHREEIEKLKSMFNEYFTLAFDVARRMEKKERPDAQQIRAMRVARDAYLAEAVGYRTFAELDFNSDVNNAIERSERAKMLGVGIGSLMLLIIAAFTLLVTRGILALEKDIEERNKKLAAVNSELELEIQKLKEAEEAKTHAEESSQFKDEFLANMSHELRTPMSAIIGLSHLCLQTEMSRKQLDYLKKIHGSAKSLLGILNDILDISKIEAGKMEVDKTPFDLEDVMGNLVTILGNKAQEKNLEFLLEAAPNVPSLLIGDPLRLGQVLINLTGNAVKFTEKGEVVVRVGLEMEKGDLVALRFSVEDSGIGMTQAEIDKLFRPFTQADTSITRKFGGTGLGLTISKRLVEMMGGKIWVESVPGKGSKFIFTASFQKSKNQTGSRLPALNDLRGLRIIAVDDSESSRQILKSYLESFTFDVTIVSNGLDALNEVRRANDDGKPFGLAILDWKMPNMDGMELARKIQDMTGLSTKPKILLASAYGQNEMSLHMDNKMIDGILAKPFQQSTLFNAISRISSQNKPGTTKFMDSGKFMNTGKFMASGKFMITELFSQELVTKIRGARLLLVEDNEINQQVAQELLEGFGIKVIIAENGEEAIALLMEEQFDGILMDMQMPVMDGVTATREIRKNPKFAKLPIIALTANVMVSEQNEFLEAGMNDHIGKPIDPDRLLATLAKWVRPTRTIPQAPQTTPVATSEPLPNLPGVNVSECLRRIGGKVAVYYALLDRFSVNERDTVSKIRAALAANDRKTAERLAHTLRGNSGTLGAEILQKQAGFLENSIKNESEVESLIASVDQELAAFIANVDQALKAR